MEVLKLKGLVLWIVKKSTTVQALFTGPIVVEFDIDWTAVSMLGHNNLWTAQGAK